MNIFALDNDPNLAAQCHHDKHVLKMILESAQLLSTAWHQSQKLIPEGIYKSTHANHPCALWVRESYSNYLWLWNLGMALCKEYTYRFAKKHRTEYILSHKLFIVPDLPRLGRTPFVQVMPPEFKHDDAIRAYQSYYQYVKAHGQKWTRRKEPSFLTDFIL